MDAIDDGSARFVDYVNNFYSHVGDNNIGAIKNQATADPRVALAEMISMLSVLRVQVSAADRKIMTNPLLSSAALPGRTPDSAWPQYQLAPRAGTRPLPRY